MDLSSVPQAASLKAIELLGTRVAPLVREALGASTGGAAAAVSSRSAT